MFNKDTFNQDFTLSSVNIKKISCKTKSNRKSGNFNLSYYDIFVPKISENKLTITFTRYLKIKKLVDIEVSFDLIWLIKAEKLTDIQNYDFDKCNEEEKDLLTTPASNQASLIISQLMNFCDYPTVITPPIFIFQDKQNEEAKNKD